MTIRGALIFTALLLGFALLLGHPAPADQPAHTAIVNVERCQP